MDSAGLLSPAQNPLGCPPITDKIFALHIEGRNISMLPGIPMLQLWPDIISRQGEDPEEYVRAELDLRKRIYPIEANWFLKESAVLRCMYVLDLGPEIEILPASTQGVVAPDCSALAWSAPPRRIVRDSGFCRHLRECVPLIERTLECLLKGPKPLVRQEDICPAVERHISSLVADSPAVLGRAQRARRITLRKEQHL
jgi:hypothetical protein